MTETNASKIQKLTSGWAVWRYLSGVKSKERQWFLGVLRGRSGFESWIAHLAKGLQSPEFLMQFENTSDPWERSKIVGEKIKQLSASYRQMSPEQRAELAKQGEIELKTGLELIGRDKKLIEDLISLVDPPPVIAS